MLEPRLQALLFPLQHASGKRDRDEEVDRLRDEVKRLRSGTPRGGADKKGGSQGKGSKRAKTSSPQMPKELIGMASKINGENLCYAFNLEGCNKGSGGRCPRGVHR
eukprot:9200753-Karenia_brevis.AAC.1